LNLGPFALHFTDSPTFKQLFPKALFGFDIEGTGEVIEDEQFGLAQQHASSGGALFLAAGEAKASGSDKGFQTVGHGG
jgi:hypothetical protein